MACYTTCCGYLSQMDTPFIQIDRGMGVPGSLWFSQTAPSQLIGQPDTTYAQQQSGNDARRDIRCGARPLAIFQHLGCFPSEARERGVAAKEAHGNSHAPVWREDHAIQSELADHAEQKAACQIYEQRAIRKSACYTNLHEALQAVTRQRARSTENSNQRETQFLSNLAGRPGAQRDDRRTVNKKLLARVCQESSDPVNGAGTVMANSIAFRNGASV